MVINEALNELQTMYPKNEFLAMLNEAYFGKTQELLELQELISKARRITSTREQVLFNTLPINAEIREKISSIFGFGNCVFNVLYGTNMYNAFTLPIHTTELFDKDFSKNLTKTRDGFKFDKKANYIPYICVTDLIFFETEKFTDGEVIALILHEVGHSFSNAYPSSSDLAFSKRILKAIIVIEAVIAAIILYGSGVGAIFGDMIMGQINAKLGVNKSNLVASDELEKQILSNKLIADINVTLNVIGKHLNTFGTNIGQLISTLIPFGGLAKLIYIPFVTTPANAIYNIYYGTKDETLSDNFATAYGFGEELSTALVKMDNRSNSADIDRFMPPLLVNIRKLSDNLTMKAFTVFDAHPAIDSRIEQQLLMLRAELKKDDIPRDIRKVIEQDIEDIEDYLNELKSKEDEINKTKGKVAGYLTDSKAADIYLNGTVAKILTKNSSSDVRKGVFNGMYKALD